MDVPSLEEARRSFENAVEVKEFVFRKLGIKDEDLKNG